MGLFALVLASCAGPAPAPVTPTVPSAPTAIPHADAIRFALVGDPVDVNVWSLFDDSGASYANYALYSDEYPRLYRLSVPGGDFEPYVADGMPTEVTQDGAYYTAGVRLQPGLTWSDGSPLTAADVAFTVNTALAFRLGYDWRSAYNPDLLDHAEAIDDATVRFYFSQPFNVGDWQYGALQGPVINRAYWSPRLAESLGLLPSDELIAELGKIQAEADALQARLDADNAQLLATLPNSTTYTELSGRVVRNQNELNSLNSHVVKLQDEYDAALNAAHAALFALGDDSEPVFGPFLRAERTGNTFVRKANPRYPFGQPNFDHAAYSLFENGSLANAAFERNEVDEILAPARAQDGGIYYYFTNSIDYLVFNPVSTVLAAPGLRHAMACLQEYAGEATFGVFVTETWLNRDVHFDCSDTLLDAKIEMAVDILKSSGYSWQQEPTAERPGSGLTGPDGVIIPAVTLLSVSDRDETSRSIIAERAQYLGIPVAVQWVDPETLRYAVLSSGRYDMAILGWHISEYPGYLCKWFADGSPFYYASDRLASACQTLNTTADLQTARQAALQIQKILVEDLPFLPVSRHQGADSYQNIVYPFSAPFDGFSGLYGAPALAIPAP